MSRIRSKFSNEMRVLITGATGFIGGTVMTRLQSRGVNVVGTTRQLNPKSDFFYVDYLNEKAMESVLLEILPTHIIHLSGTNFKKTQESEWKNSADSDFLMNSNVFNAASKLRKLPHVIFIGSCEEYGVLRVPFSEHDICSPVTSYGESKNRSTNLLIEIAKNVGMKSIVLRPSVVYGIGQFDGMLIPNLVENLLTQNIFRIKNPKQIRDFIHVDDLARAILMALENDVLGQEPILNIASGLSFSIEEVVQKVIYAMGVDLSEYVIFETEQKDPNNAEYYRVQNSLAFRSMGWKPKINFEQGLIQYIEWRRKEMTRFSQP